MNGLKRMHTRSNDKISKLEAEYEKLRTKRTQEIDKIHAKYSEKLEALDNAIEDEQMILDAEKDAKKTIKSLAVLAERIPQAMKNGEINFMQIFEILKAQIEKTQPTE